MTAHWLLFYDYVPDYLERRAEFRADHFAHAREYEGRDELLMAGAFREPADGGVLVFCAESVEVPESFARNDPYVRNGLVTAWRVRRWVNVLGETAESS